MRTSRDSGTWIRDYERVVPAPLPSWLRLLPDTSSLAQPSVLEPVNTILTNGTAPSIGALMPLHDAQLG
jgi:hypothetical protein